jgi:hypothetical protein
MRALLLVGCSAAIFAAAPALSQASQTSKTPATPARAAAAAAVPAPSADDNPVDPNAVAALRRMSDYLTKLNSFRLTADSSLDVVTVDDQKVQLDAVVKYKARRPNGIMIDFQNDQKSRQFFYNGKTFTIYAPKLGFYATVPAPPTNKEFLKAVYEKTGVSLPLEDLFRWNDGDDSDIQKLTSAFSVGTATIDGVSTDHWAFREKDFDWELWIQRGDQPLPRKIVIIDRTDESRPGYTARLTWDLNPTLTDADFAFTPGPDAKQIHIVQLEEAKK